MKSIVVRVEQFTDVCGNNHRWSEMLIHMLLEAVIFANSVMLKCHPEIRPLYEYASKGLIRYIRMPGGDEHFVGVLTVLRQGGGDCFPQGTLLLNRLMQLIPIESIEVGDQIWGLDQWSTVEDKQFKGSLPVDAVHLNNGSTVCLTRDHKVYVLRCPKHGASDLKDRYGCRCPISDRIEERIRVADLKVNDVIARPARIPFGEGENDPDRDYVEGLFISDGWSDQSSRFAISGQDGCPKEKQKKEVESICARLGLHTRWHRKYIAVNDREWALRMQQMGDRAVNKHALDINLGESSAAAILRGIMADSGAMSSGTGRVFTTTSKQLATQVRVLHKMFGIDCGYRFVENHGGLGKHPVYRLGTRGTNKMGHAPWMLCVRSITRAVYDAPCWDIQTSDHRVYLPEHDVTVSNCDQLTAWRIAELRVRGSQYYPKGEPAKLHLIRFNRPGKPLLYHVQVERAPTPQRPKGWIEDPSKLLGMSGGG